MCGCCLDTGDLATMFVLEDRVTARTNSGENEPEGNPNNTPEASTVVGSIVGKTPPSEWGRNITDQILELKVGTCTLLGFTFRLQDNCYTHEVICFLHQDRNAPCFIPASSGAAMFSLHFLDLLLCAFKGLYTLPGDLCLRQSAESVNACLSSSHACA